MRVLTSFLLICGLVLASAGPPPRAGAWPQEQGAWFIASTVELGFGPLPDLPAAKIRPITGWSAVYAEFGLTRRLTLAFDYGRSLNQAAGVTGRQQAFLLMRLDLAPEATWRRAISAGIGAQGEDGAAHLGLHLGRGFGSRWGPGWMNLDLSARQASAAPDPLLKLDLTAGLQPVEKLRVMLSVQAEAAGGSSAEWRLAPGAVLDTHFFDIELGLIARPGAPEDSRIKLGIWQNF